jgi:quercetin dioxygenase-like cupin family protein
VLENIGMKLEALVSAICVMAWTNAGVAAEAGGKEPVTEKVVVKQIASSSITAAGDPVVFPQKDAQVVVSTFEIPPGASLPVHKHLFPRYGYVLQGALSVTNTETGKAEVFKTGDFILEAVGHWHWGGSVAKTPTKLLVIDLVEKGQNNTVLKD